MLTAALSRANSNMTPSLAVGRVLDLELSMFTNSEKGFVLLQIHCSFRWDFSFLQNCVFCSFHMKINHVIFQCNQGHATLLVAVMPLQMRELSLLVQGFDHSEESCNLNILYWWCPRSSENCCRKFLNIWKIRHYQPSALQLPDLHTTVRRANGESDRFYLTGKPDLVQVDSVQC